MKTNPSISTIRTAVIAAGGFALISTTHATPPAAPDSPIESAEIIQMELYHDRLMEGAEISVEIEDKVAVLSGTALSIAQAERAAARAYCSPEILSVADNIHIKAHQSGDIAAASARSLDGKGMLDDSGISVEAIGSTVILNGEIGSTDEAELAREIVSQVNGVTAVENRLVVNFESIRSDNEIAAQLGFVVLDDPLFAGLDLAPVVKNGIVTWSGQVGSKGEFDRLVRKSYVTGIIEVNASGVRVNSDLAMEASEDKDYTPEQGVEAFDAAIAFIPGLQRVRAENLHGIMVVKGSVASEEIAACVERTARAIPGVLGVSNELKTGREELAVKAKRHSPGIFSSSIAPMSRPTR